MRERQDHGPVTAVINVGTCSPFMNSSLRKGSWQREELLQLLTLSGTLAGLCITGVTLFHALGRPSLPQTIADDTLAISALLYLVCTYTIFFALKTRHAALAMRLEKAADVLFLLALTGMAAAVMLLSALNSLGPPAPRHTLAVGTGSRMCDRLLRICGKFRNWSSSKWMRLATGGGVPCMKPKALGSDDLASR